MTATSASAPVLADQVAKLQQQLNERTAERDELLVEKVRLIAETNEAVERQTATSDILRVIANSPDDLQPVFDAIALRANGLVNGLSTAVFAHDDEKDIAHLRAFSPVNPVADAALRAMFPMKLSGLPFREILRRGEIYSIPDTELDDVGRPLGRARGYRSILFVPLISDRVHIGSITITRAEAGLFSDHQVQMMQTFADHAGVAISNARLLQEVQERTRQLSASLDDLRTAQDRLVQTEKLASLGQLTAGIAHEIKNPLNFINNFSALSSELIQELNEIIEPLNLDASTRKQVSELSELLKSNLEKVVQHGKRADSIVKNMLLHSRTGASEVQAADINAIVEESLNLAYHGARAEKSGFNITLQRDLDPEAGLVDLYPQEITRVLLNLISNGFYAATKRKQAANDDFEPTLSVSTRGRKFTVEVRIRDNGTGIPADLREKIFNPFFTTKPAGEGTGLGLSLSHDIVVKQHAGSIDVDSKPDAFTEFLIVLPRAMQNKENRRGST